MFELQQDISYYKPGFDMILKVIVFFRAERARVEETLNEQIELLQQLAAGNSSSESKLLNLAEFAGKCFLCF